MVDSADILNAGLLIVDEEQHFGVTHKERLKQLRSSVDVLPAIGTHNDTPGLLTGSLAAQALLNLLAVVGFPTGAALMSWIYVVGVLAVIAAFLVYFVGGLIFAARLRARKPPPPKPRDDHDPAFS